MLSQIIIARNCCRYYLLVITKPSDFIDVQAMTKKACIMVWVVAIPTFFCTRIVEYVTIAGKSFPDIPNIKDIDRWALIGSMLISNFFYNIPDFISIVVYLKMSKYFSKKSVYVHPNPPDQEGIWVGNNEVAAPPHVANHQDETHQDQTNESKAILAKLRLHVTVSLMDMAYHVINAVLVRTLAGSIVIKVYLVVICFWLPLLVVKVNVKQLNGMVNYVIEFITCQSVCTCNN